VIRTPHGYSAGSSNGPFAVRRAAPKRVSRRSAVGDAVKKALGRVADVFVLAGISANLVTGASLVVGAGAGALLAFDHFGPATVAVVLSSVGDALDGQVARKTRSESPGGALFDATADRYQEFFVLGGLALLFRANAVVLGLVLLALAASFMVSYGSAKAEAFGVPVPPGPMRRPERAACLCAGIAMVAVIGVFGGRSSLPASVTYAPVFVALAAIAALGNVSAILRLRAVALSLRPSWPNAHHDDVTFASSPPVASLTTRPRREGDLACDPQEARWGPHGRTRWRRRSRRPTRRRRAKHSTRARPRPRRPTRPSW
jgi:phosphatidylglycerophosphate synthase